VGTSLVCIQGDWSNIVDAKIKSRLASLAVDGTAEHPYNPLYARAGHMPKPWGVSAIFAEYTGHSAALDLDWSLPRSIRPARPASAPEAEVAVAARETTPSPDESSISPEPVVVSSTRESAPIETRREFSTLWEFAVALNRQDPAALGIARNGADHRIPVVGLEVRKLLTTVWFRSAFEGLSDAWRQRLLEALIQDVVIPNHALKCRRGVALLRTLDYAEMKELFANTFVPDAVRIDLELLLAAGRLWGEEALSRFRFVDPERAAKSSRLGGLLQSFRP